MAVSFVTRKCTQCAGKLEYIKDKKIWRCLYCGAEIERQEQYDGLFTIKNVVRQALLDTAFRRLDSASKNLIECEKIDARYMGTLIAKIAFEMITVSTPGACSDRDSKNIFAQLKKNYELLREQNGTISDDEEALYEFLEEADIYATLILVFDTLNDTARRDYVASLLNAGEVYSKAANGNLLSYAIKKSSFDTVDDIISNAANVDVKAALAELLAHYPDGDKKAQNVSRLFATGDLKAEDKPIVEKYLSDSPDAVATKVAVTAAALAGGMRLNLGTVIENVLRNAEKEQVERVVTVICREKLSDEDVMRLVDLGFSSGASDVAISVLDCIKRSGQYLLIPAKMLISLLGMQVYSSGDKVAILKKCFEFRIENKALEAVTANYLCCNSSPFAERKPVIDCLFEKAVSFPTNTVETYVLRTDTDGAEKPGILAAMFDKGLNASFCGDLLSKYMNSTVDPREIKEEIVDILSEKGMRIDPGAFINYICSSPDELPDKMRFIRKMINNGSQLRGDAADAYLQRTAPSAFSSELFSLIVSPGSTFSAKGIEKYLLEMKDREAIKADNVKTLIEHSCVNVSSMKCRVTHLGSPIECNLLQAYVLTTTESQELAEKIAEYLITHEKLKINAEISVSGSTMKLKKYVAAHRAELSEVTDAICAKYKVYSMFF